MRVLSVLIQCLMVCAVGVVTGISAAVADTSRPEGVSFDDVLALPATQPDRTVAYGGAASQRILVWEAAAETPKGLVILLHGGCWLADYDVGHIHPLASWLSDHGYAVWAPEYRRVGEPGGGWPGTFADVGAAIDQLAQVPGLSVIRPRIFMGHSAGGHLALWSGGRAEFGVDSTFYAAGAEAPDGVIGLAAITDLERYANGDNSCESVTPRLMGGMPDEQPSRYAAVSPVKLQIAPPVVLLQGDADVIVGPEQQLDEARLETVSGAGHFDFIHPGTPAAARVLQILNAWQIEPDSGH